MCSTSASAVAEVFMTGTKRFRGCWMNKTTDTSFLYLLVFGFFPAPVLVGIVHPLALGGLYLVILRLGLNNNRVY